MVGGTLHQIQQDYLRGVKEYLKAKPQLPKYKPKKLFQVLTTYRRFGSEQLHNPVRQTRGGKSNNFERQFGRAEAYNVGHNRTIISGNE